MYSVLKEHNHTFYQNVWPLVIFQRRELLLLTSVFKWLTYDSEFIDLHLYNCVNIITHFMLVMLYLHNKSVNTWLYEYIYKYIVS